MKRALVVYVEDKPSLLMQFGWLYTSLKYIEADDTDLVVFGTKNALKKIPDDCIKIEQSPISYNKEWQNYHYINSIACVADDSAAFLNQYDLLLRTDVDTFLTPAWKDFFPDYYTVGGGGYVNDSEVSGNLKTIAQKLGYRHQGHHNIGSTHYGWAPLVRNVCIHSLAAAKYIINNEFSNGYGIWPGWYKGVVSMYSNEIAVNHLVDKVIIDGNKLDYFSTSSESTLDHPHIHCWHTAEMFSKFAFELGYYDHIKLEELDQSIVKDYCLFIALKAKQERIGL
ncbi:hypothetical protein E2K98_14130 [Bacillus salipaludis]|uniref:DUF7164 domain-containing protein n=1 Tax=Bacillus salipaludis TaxID=2547811 RepID=A0A4R5VQJ3_9BACI|nr:hypothetical protein [Bacillus salipaludis]MDQ6598592.1 hypothetical protein [Bacillus salipaludis]TDK60858.1 hypothetical protein E2K98_14130 [Bacillus salipaludis]